MLIKRLTVAATLASILLMAAPLQARTATTHAKKATHVAHAHAKTHAKASHGKTLHAKRAHGKTHSLAKTRHLHTATATVDTAVAVVHSVPALAVYPLLTLSQPAAPATTPLLARQGVSESRAASGSLVALQPFASGRGPVLEHAADPVDADNDHGIDQDSNGDLRKTLIAMAMKLRDIPYVRGGRDPSTGFDCSGFVRYVFAHAIGLQLPTNSASQFLAGLKVKRGDMQPGDLVFFHTSGRKRISHVGIYIDNGRFIHSPSRGKSVEVSSLDETYWSKRFVGARRPEGIAQNG